MIIQVDYQWHYNAPADTKVGDRVKLPGGNSNRASSRWVGEVTAVRVDPGAYDGEIKSIVGLADPEVTFKANTHAGLERKVRAWLNQQEARRLRGSMQAQQSTLGSLLQQSTQARRRRSNLHDPWEE